MRALLLFLLVWAMPAFSETIPATPKDSGSFTCYWGYNGPYERPGGTASSISECQSNLTNNQAYILGMSNSWSILAQTKDYVDSKLSQTVPSGDSSYTRTFYSRAVGNVEYSCPSGYSLTGSNCVKDSACPAGYIHDAAKDICVPETCPEGQSNSTGVCQPTSPEPSDKTPRVFPDVHVCQISSPSASTCIDGSTPTIPLTLNGDGWSYRSDVNSGGSVGACNSISYSNGQIWAACDVTGVYWQNDGAYSAGSSSSTSSSTSNSGGVDNGQVNIGACGGVGQLPCNGSSTCGGAGQPACACGGVGQPSCESGSSGGSSSGTSGATCGGPGQLPCNVAGQCGGSGQPACSIAGQCGAPGQPSCSVDLGSALGSAVPGVDMNQGHAGLNAAGQQGVDLFNSVPGMPVDHGWSWTPWIPSAGCGNEPFVVGPYRGSMNLCEAAGPVREIGAWVFGVATLFALFNILTGHKSES